MEIEEQDVNLIISIHYWRNYHSFLCIYKAIAKFIIEHEKVLLLPITYYIPRSKIRNHCVIA